MPEIFRELGFVFFFYTNEGSEPMHVHVRKAGGFAKYWIEPLELDFSQGMKITDLKIAEQLIMDHLTQIKAKWYETSMIQITKTCASWMFLETINANKICTHEVHGS